jgi:hypothetical protein
MWKKKQGRENYIEELHNLYSRLGTMRIIKSRGIRWERNTTGAEEMRICTKLARKPRGKVKT